MCFPFKTIKGKALNSFGKPWLTKSLLWSINKKNRLYKQYLCHQSNEKLLKYKTSKNKLTNLLRVAKRLYFQKRIEVNKTNIKQMWRILNKAVGQSKKDEIDIPVTNVGPNLADKIAPVSKSFQDFINSVLSDWLSSLLMSLPRNSKQ